jgi:hypothetical protein
MSSTESNLLVSIGAQIPIVAAFVWYSIYLYRQFADFLREERTERARQRDEERAERARQNEQITAAINRNTTATEHLTDITGKTYERVAKLHEEFTIAMARMNERERTTPRKKETNKT